MCESNPQYSALAQSILSKNITLAELIEEQVKQSPNDEAILFNHSKITYNQLNDKANYIASQLIQLGMKQGAIVALLLDRSINTITSLLAILKVGGTYLPIEPYYPTERINFILKDCKATLLITDTSSIFIANQCLYNLDPKPNLIILGEDSPTTVKVEKKLDISFNKDSLAYIIYTSGSTGQPKGVMVTQKNVINYINWFSYTFKFNKNNIIDFSSPLAFDFSVTCTLLPLIKGGCISIATKECKSNPRTYLQYLKKHKITHVKLTPSYFSQLVDAADNLHIKLPNLRWIILGGEAVLIKDVKEWLDFYPHQYIVNEYGPTETTVATSGYIVTKNNIDAYTDIVPMGKPAFNTQFYVLDENKNLVDMNKIGELYIGGDSVSKGYLNQPKLTKQSFIKNNFSKQKSSTLYKTGDLVRQLSDSNFEYIGRNDTQVKIRGYRVELSEIERSLLKHAYIQQCIVINKRKNFNLILIAYVVLKKTKNLFEIQSIKSFLKQKLPSYMIPSKIIVLKQLPLTTNGKIDRAALPVLALLDDDRPVMASRNSTEKILQDIFAKILHQDAKLISIEDDFFAIGGDSLLAMQFTLECHKVFNLEFPAHFLFENPNIIQLSKQIEHYSKAHVNKLPPIKIVHDKKRYIPQLPSFAQQRLWFLHQLHPNSTYYNVFIALELKGLLNSHALEKSFAALIHQHESLRTRFVLKNDLLYQIVMPNESIQFTLPIEDFIDQPAQMLEREAHDEAQKPFNLEQAPLLRIRLLQCHVKRHLLFITFHHVIIDGTSIHLLFKQLTTLYADYLNQDIVTPQIKAFDYLDFSLWHRDWLSSSSQQEIQRQYWIKQLKNLPPLELATDYHRPLAHSYKGSHYTFKIDQQLTQQLHHLAQAIPTTLFITLLTGFFIVLSRYTQQDDIAVGTPNASRHYPGFESLIGFFINLLILRCQLTASTNVYSLLKENHKTLIQAFAHQDLPFEQIIEALHPSRETMTNPLCSILFVFQNYAHNPLTLKGLKIKRIFSDNDALLFSDYESSKFDLTLYLQENDEGLDGLIEFNTDLFKRDTIVQIANHFQNVLLAMVENPNQLILEIPLLSPKEIKTILKDWNHTQTPYPHHRTISQLFSDQVAQSPDNVAVIYNYQSFTYRALQNQADQLTYYIIKQGVQPGSLVGLCLERNLYILVASLSVLKAGAAYIPIDPNFPQERIEKIIKDSQAKMLLVNSLQCSRFKKMPLDQIIILAVEECEKEKRPDSSLPDLSESTKLAYVLYTSGSTGIPKGVAINHYSLINLLFAMQKELQLTAQDSILALTPFTFDISGLELYLPLILGATCVLVDKRTAMHGGLLKEFLNKQSVTLIQATPATWYLLLNSGWKGDKKIKLLSGGEALSNALGEKLLKSSPNLWNVYGPTETTIWSTIEKVKHIEERSLNALVPIGKPLANTRAYVLDKNSQPCPIGCIGELYLAGDGLAQGYLHSPDLTANSFILSPLLEIQETRLYKTGDRVRWLADGRLDFLGRSDNQVKIRGFRIELSEIEYWLVNHPFVSQAVVIPDGKSAETERLLAYIVLNHEDMQNEHYQKLQQEQVEHWKAVYNEIYQQASIEKIGLITDGWISSYTQQAIPLIEMQTWIDSSIERILALQPKRVLEIGCGTGMLLLRLLPSCEFYCATDQAEQALTHCQTQIAQLGIPVPVKLLKRPAYQLQHKENKAYDTIILNSVVQYFPSSGYLLTVLENAISAVQTGGHVFIGDVRSLNHLEAFCAEVQLARSTSKTTIRDWQEAIKKQIQQEEELVIAPAFFQAFATYHPRISSVTIQLKQGQYTNEMTQFRYDVVLHIEKTTCGIELTNWLNWQKEPWYLDKIKAYLSQNEPAYFAIQHIPNPRLAKVNNVLRYTKEISQDCLLLQSIDFIKPQNPLIDLDDLWEIEKSLPYHVEINWSSTNPLSTVDVIFRHSRLGYQPTPYKSKVQKSRNIFTKKNTDLTNKPMKVKWHQQALTQLRHYLKTKLPYYMLPSLFVELDTIPLTTNGKVDYNSLPQPQKSPSNQHKIAPRDDTETQMITLWQKILQLDELSINDNFFDLGGHSLLAIQLISKIKSIFKVDLGINALFECPTIALMSKLINKKKVDILDQTPVKVKPILSTKTESLIILKSQGSYPPLFLFHPIGGSVLCYNQLHQQAILNHPIYAFQDPSLETKEICFISLEEMAGYYLNALEKTQPEGPYFLGGYSLGGTVAIEVAAQLRAKHKTVAWLGFFDTWAFSHDKPELAEIASLRAETQYKIFQEKLQYFPGDNHFFNTLYQHHRMLLAQYCLSPIHCPIHLFKAIDTKNVIKDDASNYWKAYASSTLNVYKVQGNHDTLFNEPHIGYLAAQISQSLAKINPNEYSTDYPYSNNNKECSHEFFD